MERILHIVPNMQSGGLETFIMNVYRNIDREKIQFDFLVHYEERKFYDNEIELLGGKIHRFSLRNDNNIFKYIKKLDAFFKEHREYKIIHCHMASIGFLIFYIARKNGVKIRIAHSHNSNTENTLKGFIKSILIKPYKYLSTHRLACSEQAGNFLFGKMDFQVIENAIDINKFLYNLDIRKKVRKELKLQDKFVIGHIGRFCEQKNHNFLIECFAKFHKESDNSVLILIGEGELKEKIQKKVKELNIDKSVIFLGNRKDVNELYQAMDCFAFPSKFEGLGIVLIEAQVSGLNVISSSNIPEEAIVTENIKLLDTEIDLWIKNIRDMSINIERGKLDGREKRYDITSVTNKIMQMYTNILEEKEFN